MKIGCHMRIDKGIDKVLYDIIEYGGNAVQIFLSPPQSSSIGKPIEGAESLKEMIRNTGIYLVVHGKYVLNFCNLNIKWQYNALVSDLRKANQLGSNIGVVIHQGKNTKKIPREAALRAYVEGIQRVIDETKDINNMIILENSCQQGTELGYTIEELSQIWGMFDDKYKKRIGFCLDTCHIFVAGSLRMKDKKEVDMFFDKFDRMIGLKNLKVIHFNDSKTRFDGHNDHHGDILRGYIGDSKKGGNMEGLKRVVYWAKRYEIPLILETPRDELDWGCSEQIALLNKWVEEID